jgi:hypothetical protein
MKHLKTSQELSELSENLNISDVSDSQKLTYDEIKDIFTNNDFDFSHNNDGYIYYHYDYHIGLRYVDGNDYIDCLETDSDFNDDGKIIGTINISGLSKDKLNKKIKRFIKSDEGKIG